MYLYQYRNMCIHALSLILFRVLYGFDWVRCYIYIIVLYNFIWHVFFIQTCKRMYLIISKFWTTTFTLSSKRKSQLLYPTLPWILQEPQHRSTKANPILNAREIRSKTYKKSCSSKYFHHSQKWWWMVSLFFNSENIFQMNKLTSLRHVFYA